MLIRMVKLSFEADKVPLFLAHFDTVKEKVRHFPGNNFMELYQDKKAAHQFFTYSIWDDEAALENYRQSELFRGIWTYIKPFFNDKPQAWSVDKLVSLP